MVVKSVRRACCRAIGGRVVTDSVSDVIQYRKAQARFQIRFGVGDGFEFLIGCHQGFVRITLALFPGLVSDGLWEQTGPMIVDVGIEVLAMKVIEQAGPALRDMGMAEQLAHDMTVLAFPPGRCRCCAGRGDLVNSIRSFSSSRATRRLMYSEPLSAWNPRMTNGKLASRCARAGMR